MMSALTMVDLGGTWRLGWRDEHRGGRADTETPVGLPQVGLDATVPGEVHRDLERQGIIASIEQGLGALAAQWVDGATWTFLRDIELEAVPASAQLVFERLELAATVFVNDVEVARHATAFLPLRIEVAEHLLPGSNRLRVELDAGHLSTLDLPAVGYRFNVRESPDKRHWKRTGQSQYGWDWSPRLPTIGITGPVRLELRDSPLRLSDVVPVVEVADDHATATVTTRVFLTNDADSAVTTTVRVAFDAQVQNVEVVAAPGESRVDVVTRVDRPALWWPRGMGEQPLHPLVVEVLGEGGGVAERRELRVGLRSVVIDQSPAPDRGTLFRIVVNGLPFFAKGGNWVPISLTPNPVPVDLLDAQLARAVEANFTLLRVWGGGDYETEEFYDRCDELGLVVWQDLIFACSRYPFGVDWFRELVETEVRHQVRRLASHASLALLAGNNEIAWIGQSQDFPGPLVPLADGATIEEIRADHAWFETAAADLVAAEDPSLFYWPSSPWSPTDPDNNAPHEGDQHPWHIGFWDVDFRKYRDTDARFPNEGGLLGPSSLPGILESLPEGQRAYGSFAWKTHDNSIGLAFAPSPYEIQFAEWTGRDIRAVSLEEYVYWFGLLHGEGLSEYIDNFRRRSATTGAAVFWMYNDCWPTVRSWTIVDSRARRTPSFHPVRRAFAPVRVGIVDAPDGGAAGAVVWVHNDTRDDVTLELEAGTFAFAGSVDTARTTVTVPALSVVEVAHLDAPTGDPLASAYVAVLRDGDRVVSRTRLLPGRYSDLPLADPDVRVRVEKLPGGGSEAVFESDVFVLGVALDLDGSDDLADDFFDLYPGMPHRIRWTRTDPPEILFTGNR
jgi:beta-mannosidase